MLVYPDAFLRKAQQGGYAVGAFNIENLEMAQAVIAAAEQMRSPVIMQTTPGTLDYASPKLFAGIVTALAQDTFVPVILHLDHGNSLTLVQQAKQAGYTSLMIDGSRCSFEENIALTKSAVDLACGVPVEAELGTVGGKEDTQTGTQVYYTDPQQAEEFVQRTGISSFAVAIGTSHGFYQGPPKLDFDRLSEIRRRVDIPLVLHGTSGVPEEQVRQAIRLGICKVNYATELRAAYTQAIAEYLAEKKETIDPKKYGRAARDRVTELVCRRIKLCGSEERI